MTTLSAVDHRRAVGFLNTAARPLEAALHAHHRGTGPAQAVREALAAFQHGNGGYGRGLEPDAQHPAPSALGTAMALQLHARIDTPGSDPQVAGALAWLREAYDADAGVWPMRPAAGPGVVSAPWWKSDSDTALVAVFEGCRLNPTADVLACFLHLGNSTDADLIAEVTVRVRAAIDGQTASLGMHDLICVARLSWAPGLDPAWRDALVKRVAHDLAATVSDAPATWGGYGLKPWWVAPTPGDPRLARLGPGLVDAMLDHEIARQGDDGGWPPFWDWGGLHPEAWPAAATAWSGVLTEQLLRVFAAFDRLPSPPGWEGGSARADGA